MANNCLVTQLKSVVDNDNLEILGGFDIDISTDTSLDFKFTNHQSGTITLVGDGYITKDGNQYKTIDQGDYYFYVPVGTYKLRISDKYTLRGVECEQANLKSFKYSNNLYTLVVDHFIGDLNDIPNSVNTLTLRDFSKCVTEIKETTPYLKYANQGVSWDECRGISGDFSLLAKIPTIISIHCAYTKLSGSIEGLISRFVSEGRNSGDITICLTGVNVTIGGIVRQYLYDNCKLVWTDENTWYYQNGPNNKVTDPNERVQFYAKNQSQEQIAEWEANGNDVTIID